MLDFSFYVNRDATLTALLDRALAQANTSSPQEMYKVCMGLKLLNTHQLFHYRPDVLSAIMSNLRVLANDTNIANSDLALVDKCFSIMTTEPTIDYSNDLHNISQTTGNAILVGRRRFEDFGYAELESKTV